MGWTQYTSGLELPEGWEFHHPSRGTGQGGGIANDGEILFPIKRLSHLYTDWQAKGRFIVVSPEVARNLTCKRGDAEEGIQKLAHLHGLEVIGWFHIHYREDFCGSSCEIVYLATEDGSGGRLQENFHERQRMAGY